MSELTPDQERVHAEAREFAMTRVLPLADRLDRRHEDIPREFLDEMAERGYFGITIPEQYGGLGLGMIEYSLVVEELARAWMSVASVVGRGNAHLDDVLDDDQRARYLPKIAGGQFIGAFALSEEDAGSDVSNVACRAERTDDGWRITGAKKWCGFAKRADYILLYARTDDSHDPDRPYLGISSFLIEKQRDVFPDGLTGETVDKIGYFGLTTWKLAFDGLELPAEVLVGEQGRAFYGVMQGLDRKRVYTAARAVGLARAGLEDALAYAQDRDQFDHAIADFQAIRFKLADMATEVAAARALTHQAARAIDAGDDVNELASMAKLFASEMSERVTSEALQIHGGNGYLSDFAVQRHWRDARLTKIFEGTSEIQRRIIADRLGGRPANG